MDTNTLRYSPVNWAIVDWRGFNDCGLPQPIVPSVSSPADPVPTACLPIAETVKTRGWDEWLPEVLVGIENPDEEIAASYVRETAIQFCEYARTLQRVVAFNIQSDVDTYPVQPIDGERIVGAIQAIHSAHGLLERSRDFELDVARDQVRILPSRSLDRGIIRLLVWATPTEDACQADTFIYDYFRRAIAQQARAAYARAVHYKDRLLMASLNSPQAWERDLMMAKNKALKSSDVEQHQPSRLWSRNTWRRS